MQLVVPLGPSQAADFEFHLGGWVSLAYGETSRPVFPEIKKMKGMRVLCIYAEEETDSVCKSLKLDNINTISIKGGHHFGGDYKTISDAILKEMK